MLQRQNEMAKHYACQLQIRDQKLKELTAKATEAGLLL
jgi:hypothetical protein